MPKLVTTFANGNQSQEYKDLLYRYLQKHKEKYLDKLRLNRLNLT